MVVDFFSSGPVLVVFLAFNLPFLPALFLFDASFFILEFLLLAHLLAPDLFALISFGFHVSHVKVVRFVARLFFLVGDFVSDIGTTDCANGANDRVQMFGRKLVNGFFHVFVDISSVHRTFNQSRCFSPLTREMRWLAFNLRFGQCDQLAGEVGFVFLRQCISNVVR